MHHVTAFLQQFTMAKLYIYNIYLQMASAEQQMEDFKLKLLNNKINVARSMELAYLSVHLHHDLAKEVSTHGDFYVC